MAEGRIGPGGGAHLTKDGGSYDLVDAAEQSLGGQGFFVAGDTALKTATSGQCFFALQMIGDTVLATLTPTATAPVTGTATGITFPAGFILYGKFASFTLTSGSCIAYLGQT